MLLALQLYSCLGLMFSDLYRLSFRYLLFLFFAIISITISVVIIITVVVVLLLFILYASSFVAIECVVVLWLLLFSC